MYRRVPLPRPAAALLALAVALLPPGPPTRADEPKEVASFADHTGHPYGLAFSPDGKTLAWAGKDKAVHLHDLAAAAKEKAKLEHKDEIDAVAFSPDGKTLVTTCHDGLVRFWDPASAKETGSVSPGYATYPNYYKALFTPDGKTLVTKMKGDGLCQLWDVTTLKELPAPKAPEGGSALVLSFALSPDGKTLAVFTFGDVYFFETATAKLQSRFAPKGKPIYADVAFTPDGKRLLRSSEDAVLIDPATGKEQPVMTKDDGPFHRLAVAPGGRLLTWTEAERMSITVWDVVQVKPMVLWKELPGDVRAMAVSPDGKLVAAPVGDSKKGYALKVWDASALELGPK
jgi:WD40 repeat protein